MARKSKKMLKRRSAVLWMPKLESGPMFNPFASVESAAPQPGSGNLCPSIDLSAGADTARLPGPDSVPPRRKSKSAPRPGTSGRQRGVASPAARDSKR